MKKLVKESLGIDSTVNADDLYIVCRQDLSDLNDEMEVFTSVDDARPHAMFLESRARKNGQRIDYNFFSIQEIINELIERL